MSSTFTRLLKLAMAFVALPSFTFTGFEIEQRTHRVEEGAVPVVGPDKSFRFQVTMPSSLSVKSKSSATRPAPADQPHPLQRACPLPPANRRLTTRHRTGFKSVTDEDGRIEDYIHAMDAEADLRWSSRVYLPDSSSSTSTNVTFNLGQRVRSKSRSRIIKDSVQAMPFDESSHIERNKRVREGAMNAIVATNGKDAQAETSHGGRERECEPNMVNDYHGRTWSSISGQGKRISPSFEVGVIRACHSYMCSRVFTYNTNFLS